MTEHSAPLAGNEAAEKAAWTAAAAAARKSGRLGADAPESGVWQRPAWRAVSGMTIRPLVRL